MRKFEYNEEEQALIKELITTAIDVSEKSKKYSVSVYYSGEFKYITVKVALKREAYDKRTINVDKSKLCITPIMSGQNIVLPNGEIVKTMYDIDMTNSYKYWENKKDHHKRLTRSLKRMLQIVNSCY